MYESWLAEAHRYFREASQQKVPLTYASEWVLDNYYIIRQALQQIEEDLPFSFYEELPRLTNEPLKDFPRIYAIARAVLSYQHLLLEPVDLQTILIQFQERVPLTMGELWALPTFLRYGLIEFLAHELVTTIHPANPPELPAEFPQIPGISNPFSPRDTAAGSSEDNEGVANIILSLRSISEQDWSNFFESVSRLEQTLRKDPAGIYCLMDFKTRDIYRKEIEKLSMATGRDENELAEIVLELARSSKKDFFVPSPETSEIIQTPISPISPGSDKSPANQDYPESTDSNTHVGEFLLGKSRPVLEKQIGYKLDLITTFKRWVFHHASGFYLFCVLLLTTLILLFILLEIPGSNPQGILNSSWSIARTPGNAPLKWIVGILLAITLVIPGLTIATSLVNWLITLVIHPHILPKLDFKNGIPNPFQTLVVIPAMITNRKEIESLVHQLELHFLRNPEPGLLFALLTDFGDADNESLPEDEGLIKRAASAIEALNVKYASPLLAKNAGKRRKSQLNNSLFFFFHRKRLWNPSERKWMGWERKRGKLHELNLLLRGGINHIIHHSKK